MWQTKANMMAVGPNGVLLETVPSREEVARKHAIEIVIHLGRLDKVCHVMDQTQRQQIAKKINVLVGTLHVSKNDSYTNY